VLPFGIINDDDDDDNYLLKDLAGEFGLVYYL